MRLYTKPCSFTNRHKIYSLKLKHLCFYTLSDKVDIKTLDKPIDLVVVLYQKQKGGTAMSVSVRPTYESPPRYRVIVWTFHILLGQVLNELYDDKRDAYKRARQLKEYYGITRLT